MKLLQTKFLRRITNATTLNVEKESLRKRIKD